MFIIKIVKRLRKKLTLKQLRFHSDMARIIKLMHNMLSLVYQILKKTQDVLELSWNFDDFQEELVFKVILSVLIKAI